MKSITSVVAEAAQQLKAAGIESAHLDAELLLAHTLGRSRTSIITHGQELIDDARFQANLQRRLAREPLAYITGEKEFYGRNFSVTPDTLIPRPESEAFFAVLAKFQPGEGDIVADIGCGSGVLAITASREFPEVHVIASDISEAALAIARRNAEKLEARVSFYHSDLFVDIPFPTAQRLFILANLPYVDSTWKDLSPELAAEPALALYSDDHGLAHSLRLLTAARELPCPLVILMETDVRQQSTLIAEAKKRGYTFVSQEGLITVYTLRE